MEKMSIKNRLFLMCSLLLILALFLTVIVSRYFTEKAIYESTVRDHRREMALITNCLQNELDHLADYQMAVALDETVMSTLKDHPNLNPDKTEYTDIRGTLSKKINSLMGMNQQSFQWDIITLDNSFLNVSGYYSINAFAEVLDEKYFTKENDGRGIVLNGPFLVGNKDAGNNQKPVVVMSKQIVDLDTLDTLGYIGFFIFESHLADIFEQNIPTDIQSEYYILSDENKILSTAEKTLIGQSFKKVSGLSDKELSELSNNGMCVKNSGGKRIFYTETTMDAYDWTVVYATSAEYLLSSQKQASLIIVLIGTAICILFLIATRHTLNKITNPIIMLSEKMRNYYAQKPKQQKTNFHGNEIQYLYSGFDAMVEDSRHLMEQIYSEQEEKSNYMFQLIQAQMKPHFLYNTLETVKSLIDIGMYDQAGDSIMALSRFYRMSLNAGNDITTVANEIELSRQYMYIQKMRYMEYLEYEIEECIDVKHCLIPKLTLQPLLENAIYHGIKAKTEGGHVFLHVKKQESFIIFVIEDDGVGMDVHQLEELRERLKEDGQKNASFGLYSINRRIQLLFGTKYGVRLESQKNCFTRVILKIPAITVEHKKT